mgnify:FL=1
MVPGKTTLLSILTGLLKQRHGEVRLDGKKLTPRQRRSLSYLVMQDTDYQLFASSVEEELSLGMQEDCKEKNRCSTERIGTVGLSGKTPSIAFRRSKNNGLPLEWQS